MPVDDNEPRFQLADADGNVVGSLYWNGSSLVFQEGTNQTEVALNESGLLDLLDVQGSMPLYYQQETEPSETPSPPPEGPGGVWAETVPPGEALWTYKSTSEVGAIYKENGDAVILGDDDNAIHAIDPSDGSEHWVFTGASSVDAPPNPVGEKDMVVCTSGNGIMYAFEVSTGIKKWEYDASSTYMNSRGVYVPDDGLVIHGDGDAKIYAVNINDGTLSWSISGPQDAYDAYDGVYASAEDLAVFPFYTGEVRAFDTTDGATAWTFNPGSAESNGTIYVADENLVIFANSINEKIYALDVSDGTEEWSYSTNFPTYGNAVWVEDKDLIVGAYNNKVFALNTSDGTVEWENTTGHDYYTKSEWIESEDLFVVGVSDDANLGDSTVYGFDTETGALEWTHSFNGGGYMGYGGSMVGVEEHNIVVTPGARLHSGGYYNIAISYADKTIRKRTSDGANWS